MAALPKRRVSYVIPPPSDPTIVPRLTLPSFNASRLGSIGPLLIPFPLQAQAQGTDGSRQDIHPRHRLGVSSLAIDKSTILSGHNSPQGILYTGGRDGLVLSWDLQLSMKKRSKNYNRRVGRWHVMTSWGDESIEEEFEDADGVQSDGDILGEVTSRKRAASMDQNAIPLENEWETASDVPGQPSQFRQCAQPHNDWINDILLCNFNQTLVSASSDGTIKTWNPHATDSSEPTTIGMHDDYVRCLTHCREQNWIASGSFDRTIKLWDLNAQGPSKEPLVTLSPPDANAPKSSIYALAADPFGSTIASGSPERVIRCWDPRSGKRTGKLVGHTDNIRAILLSDDSKYLLSGSADASIKLWSMASQRCLHTFTHHTDSVWSLSSSHPFLETFYSGDKSGLVCKVDVEGCSDVSEGECIVLCHDTSDRGISPTEGITKIVQLDDNLLWTATGNSSVKRWKIPPSRTDRASAFLPDVEPRSTPTSTSTRSYAETHTTGNEQSSLSWPVQPETEDSEMLYGIPFSSLVRLISPNETFYNGRRGKDPEVATLYSAASVRSVPRQSIRSPLHTNFSYPNNNTGSRPEEISQPTRTAQLEFEEREVATDAIPLCDPDFVISGDRGLLRAVILNDRIHCISVQDDGQVAVWDIVRGLCRGTFSSEDVTTASRYTSSASNAEHSPREVLEAIRERIEGEGAVVPPWASVDTKTGVLAVHVNERCFEAEIYADEVGFTDERYFNDESRINIGKWVLRNLFLSFIREELRVRRDNEDNPNIPALRRSAPNYMELDDNEGSPKSRRSSLSESSNRKSHRSTTSSVISSPRMIPAISPSKISSRTSPLLTPMIPLYIMNKENSLLLPSIPQSPSIGTNDVTPMPLVPLVPLRLRTTLDGQVPATPKDVDYFSLKTRQQSVADEMASPAEAKSSDIQAPTTPGGIMGRLKSLGKVKRTADVVSTPAVPVVVATVQDVAPPVEDSNITPLQTILSNALTPASYADAPQLQLAPNITVIVEEEASSGWSTIYRAKLCAIHKDVYTLEETLPIWLLEYLLLNKAPEVPVNKLSFILTPWPSKDPNVPTLPELLNTTQSKLTASRFLRVRKLVLHIQDKLDKEAPADNSSTDAPALPNAEDVYEIVCNDTVLPLDMTLAAIRQYVWRQATELVMHYRLKASAN